MVLFFALTGGMAWLAWFVGGSEVVQALEDRAVWARGVSAERGELDGSRDSYLLGLVKTYSFEVRYVDRQGQEHHGQAAFRTTFAWSDKDDPVIRYDPLAPDRFALSWVEEHFVSRVIQAVLMLILLGPLVLVLLWVSLRAVPGVLRGGRALEASPLIVVPADGSTHRLFVDASFHRVVALQGPEGTLRLAGDGFPLRLSEEQRKRIVAALAVGAPAAQG